MSLSILQRLAFVVLVLEFCSIPQIRAQDVVDSSNVATSASFEELKAQVAAVPADARSNDAISKLIEAWVRREGIDHLSVDQLQWCLEQSLPNVKDQKSFSVVWTGSLTPPRNGTYIFSVSPINVNTLVDQNSVRHTIVVSVADKKVIDVGPSKDAESRARRPSARDAREEPLANEWQWKGLPIELRAGQPVPLQFEMTYECREPSAADSPSAILCWEGPGIGRQVISKDVFTSIDGSEKGLRAEYALQDSEGPPRLVIQSSPNIDFTWSTPADVAPADPTLVAQLTNRLWQLATTPEFLGRCAAGTSVHPYFQSNGGTEFLTSAQRSEFLRLLVDSQQLLGRVDDRQLLQLYRSLRFGAEEDAIDMLGTWMQLKADITPKITADFFRENRQVYAELAMHLAHQQHGAYGPLQDRYLEMSDGRCALPAAYVLAFCHLIDWRRDDFASLIQAKLDDDSLAAVARINWLLAQAMLAEQKGTGPHIELTAATPWLDEAALVAEDAGSRQRILNERVARRVLTCEWESIEQELDGASAPPEWHKQVQQLKADWESRQRRGRERSEAAVIAELERRLAIAQHNDDSATSSQLEGFLDAAKADAANIRP